MLTKNKSAIFLALLALILASLACSMNIGGPEAPEAVIPISTEAANSLSEEIKVAFEAGLESGTVTLVINETQITSLLAFKLEGDETPLFTNPQVFLRNGQMQIYGQAQQGYFVANIGIMVNISVDEQGQPDINVTSVDFGPLPVPNGLTASISALIQEAYTGAVGPVATGLRIQQITVADGLMTIIGQAK